MSVVEPAPPGAHAALTTNEAGANRSALAYRAGSLYIEDIEVERLAAKFGTPLYVYSKANLTGAYQSFTERLAAREHLICYAVKANGNLGLLNVLARLGAGFDIVSVGELERVMHAGGDPSKVVFSGVGKQAYEMRRALQLGIACFNVESEAELSVLESVAEQERRTASISLRVNPDVDAATHPYISTGLEENKFGIPIGKVQALYERAAASRWLHVAGIDCHIGSQLTELSPVLDALDRVLELLDELEARGIAIEHLDLGGGLGIRYKDEVPPTPAAYVDALLNKLQTRPQKLIFEPGRAIVGAAGVLLTRVIYAKDNGAKRFAIVDAAMNDLLRPALYQGWHEIRPAQQQDGSSQTVDVVGPVCESADFLGIDRPINAAAGDLLAVGECGAYSFSMSSNYNARPRAAEVLVDGDQAHLIRERERVEDLWRGEHIIRDEQEDVDSMGRL